MANPDTSPTTAATIAAIRADATALLNTPIESLLRPDLKDRGFSDHQTEFEITMRAVRIIAAGDFVGVIDDVLAVLGGFLHDVRLLYNELTALSPLEHSWEARRQRIISRIQELRDKRSDLLGALAFIRMRSSIDDDAIHALRERLAQGASDLDQLKRAISEQRDELDNIITAAQKVAREATISARASVFESEANSAAASARKWLRGAAIAATVLLGIVIWHLATVYAFTGQLQLPQVVQMTIAKLIAYSFAVSLVLWLGRNFRVSQHNALVNKHRANALRCFEALALSTSSDDVRNAILVQATQSIFSPQSTGFIGEERDVGGGSQILEIYRGVSALPKATSG